MIKQFEYRRESEMRQWELNKLGKEGWELISVNEILKDINGSGCFTYFFKRERKGK